MKRLRVAIVLALAASACVRAPAQGLQRLTVTSFALSADTVKPVVDVPFHVFVTLHVRENVASIEQLELPSLAALEVLGDERKLASDAGGTSYRETITLVAHHAETVHVPPATLDAVDARDGRPKRYSTNDLTLTVVPVPGAAPVGQSGPPALQDLDALLMRAMVWTFGIAIPTAVALGLVIWLITRPRPAVAVPPATAAAAEPKKAPASRDVMADARAAFAAAPSRLTASQVRDAARLEAGAAEKETLADLQRRVAPWNPRLAGVLSAAERATFTNDAALSAALDSLRSALERYTA